RPRGSAAEAGGSGGRPGTPGPRTHRDHFRVRPGVPREGRRARHLALPGREDLGRGRRDQGSWRQLHTHARSEVERVSIAIIVNPISGGVGHGAARRRAEIASALLASSREEGEVFVTERKGHARELAAGAVARGARLVVAWGGDGTVNEVASSLVFGSTS